MLGQEATEEKSNEIAAIPKRLELLELKGGIVTLDAMGCPRAIAAQIVAQFVGRTHLYVSDIRRPEVVGHIKMCPTYMAAEGAGRVAV
jgi:predicted transposase YbfD/YdcC